MYLRPIMLGCLIFVFSGGTTAFAHPLWHAYEAPNPPLVRTEHDAITVAHTYWHIIQPQIPAEDAWQRDFQASLRDGVWEVTEKPNNLPKSMLHIFVGAQDGRFLGSAMID